MPPHKARARGNHHPQPPQPQPSDYETDAAPPAVDVPLPPPRSNEELNLSVLKRVYPELQAIEHVTPYAALYTFNLETQQWEKVGVEGTLFVCQLIPSPVGAERYCVVILNRRGLDNFYLELLSSEDVEISDPYVILQAEQVYGIWIFADPPPSSTANCRVETAEKIMDAADRARASKEAQEASVNNGHDHANTHPDASVPMGRQLSLRDLFGQQRQQDAPTQFVQPHTTVQQPAPNTGFSQQDVLSQLFMKAKQDYNAHG